LKSSDVSELRPATIVALIMEAVRLKRPYTFTRLHGAITQKAVTFKMSPFKKLRQRGSNLESVCRR
jgi:hypothetical protein